MFSCSFDFWSRNRKDFLKRSPDSSSGFLFRPLHLFTFCREDNKTSHCLPDPWRTNQQCFLERSPWGGWPSSTWQLVQDARQHSQEVPPPPALFSHRSLGVCPRVTAGRGCRTSLAADPHGFQLCKCLLSSIRFLQHFYCLFLGHPCKPPPQMPLCVPAVSHRWKTLFTFSYSWGNRRLIVLLSQTGTPSAHSGRPEGRSRPRRSAPPGFLCYHSHPLPDHRDKDRPGPPTRPSATRQHPPPCAPAPRRDPRMRRDSASPTSRATRGGPRPSCLGGRRRGRGPEPDGKMADLEEQLSDEEKVGVGGGVLQPAEPTFCRTAL